MYSGCLNTTNNQQKFIAYYRVSTGKQGKSQLGLEAQKAAERLFLTSKRGDAPLYEFTEVESGNKKNLPQPTVALWQCKKQKATLIIAKLDGPARNVHFVGPAANFCARRKIPSVRHNYAASCSSSQTIVSAMTHCSTPKACSIMRFSPMRSRVRLKARP